MILIPIMKKSKNSRKKKRFFFTKSYFSNLFNYQSHQSLRNANLGYFKTFNGTRGV